MCVFTCKGWGADASGVSSYASIWQRNTIFWYEKDLMTAWKVSVFGSYSGPYFPTFGLNMDQNNSEYRHLLGSVYLKEPPAKLLKTYLKDSGNIYFVVIYGISIWLNYCFKLNQVFSVVKIDLLLRWEPLN